MKQVALIGVGKMGLSHLAIASSTKGMNVVAVCDRSRSLLRAIKKNLQLSTYLNFKDMIDNESIESAIVSVPNSSHCLVVEELLKREINVFIEKPLTLNYDDSRLLRDISYKKKIYLQVGYVNRFNPIFSKLKEFIDMGLFGSITEYRSEMQGGVITKRNDGGWRNNYTAGGGCLYDYGPHCIDLACYLFGHDMTLLSSKLNRIHSTNVDDEVNAVLRHSTGAKGQLYVNWSNATLRKASNTITATGEFGSFRANKQEIIIDLTHERSEMGYTSGHHEIYITDLDTKVDYYLRGEDFSRQMLSFSNEINGVSQANPACIEGAVVTDRLISEILSQNGVI